eukprot:gene1113-10627_t
MHLYNKIKRSRLPSDVFFDEGNQLADMKTMNQYDDSEDIEQSIYCDICDIFFENENSFQIHYNLKHFYTCSQCQKNFLSSKILEIHVLENHDFYFKVLSEKQKMFECFIEGCNIKFNTKSERQQHLNQDHGVNENLFT